MGHAKSDRLATDTRIVDQRDRWVPAIYAIGLTILVMIVFAVGMDIGPVAEDFIQPKDFITLRSGYQFRPGFALSHMALRTVVGPIEANPAPYHILSLVFHIATTLGIFWLARSLSNVHLGAAAALIFGLIPRHHEVVFWPVSASHPLMALCLVLCLIAYIHGTRVTRASWRAMGAATLIFAVGIFSNEACAIGVGIILAYEWIQPGAETTHRPTIRQLIRRLAPFVVVTAMYAALLILSRDQASDLIGSHSDKTFYHLDLSLSKFKEYVGYIGYTLLPFVPLRSLNTLTSQVVVGSIAVLVLGLALWRGNRLARFGLAWLLISVLPYVLFVPYGNADRYTYLPSMGACLMVIGMGQQALGRVQRRSTKNLQSARGALIVILLLYGVCADVTIFARAQEWHTAGEGVDSVLAQIYAVHPVVHSDDTFYVLNLPETLGQAHFLGVGLQHALRSHYGQRELAIYESRDPGLIDAVVHSSCADVASPGVTIYIYSNGTLTDYSTRFSDPVVRQFLSGLGPLPKSVAVPCGSLIAP